VVRLNSIDDLGPRRAYIEQLKEYYRPLLDRLSEDSQRRFQHNPLRLLDSKDDRDQPLKEGAPKLVNQLSPEAAAHHETVQAGLAAAKIPFVIDPLLVRGLDYYNRTVFEIVPVEDERAQGTIGAGGRYDGLMEILGGPHVPCVGFGSGLERIILEMEKNGVAFPQGPTADVFIVHRAEGSLRLVAPIARELRSAGVAVVVGESGKSLKSQLRSADAAGARFAVIIGESEASRSAGVLKDLRGEAEQVERPLASLAAELVAILRPS
jgi:histidyl-tRNA synthetase